MEEDQSQAESVETILAACNDDEELEEIDNNFNNNALQGHNQ